MMYPKWHVESAARGTQMKLRMFSALALSVVASLSGSAYAQTRTAPAGKLFFEGDIVRHALMGQEGPFCVLNNRYTRGEAVAFRQRVLKPDGTVADNTYLKSVEIELGNGNEVPLHYGGHGMAPTGFFLSSFLAIPLDFPPGALGGQIKPPNKDRPGGGWGALPP